ncbi:hypothetical protein [Haladaptatus halobius]|uniref:hypothetical protein n=1 Tax=Haladaptatus halobius TaxID=2884875 RepID=UPI001D0B2E51|nr:hypothetical protein [Haladaptatus halobius]
MERTPSTLPAGWAEWWTPAVRAVWPTVLDCPQAVRYFALALANDEFINTESTETGIPFYRIEDTSHRIDEATTSPNQSSWRFRFRANRVSRDIYPRRPDPRI